MTGAKDRVPLGGAELEPYVVDDALRHMHSDLVGTREDPRPDARLVVGGAAALFAAIFAARLAIEDPPALIANFYTVPTAMLAVAYGVRAGLIGALVSTTLVFLWPFVQPIDVSALGYAARIAVVVLVGAVVGHYSERLRADIARRRETERELELRAQDLARSNARLAQAVRRLEALSNMARATGSETDLHRALARILELGRELAGGAALSVWSRGDGRPVPLAASPPLPDDAGYPQGAVAVPLEHRGEPLGTLAVEPPPDGPAPDPDLLAAIAASAAATVVTVRSIAAERLRDAIDASERERARWAWELHDQTLQSLVGVRVLLSSALRSGDAAVITAAAREALDEIQLETSTLEHLIAELRPAALDELGLEPALAALGERVATVSGLEVDTRLALPEAALPPDLQSTVYRVAQEALTNVAKHAGAERACLAVNARDGTVSVEVTDDGRGFDPDAAHDGLGLRGMRERVALAGGRLDVRTGPRGTRVSATLPVPRDRAALSPPPGEAASPVRPPPPTRRNA